MDTPVEGSGPSILDINILPPRYRRRGLNWRAALPWLICVALGLLLLPSVYLLTASFSEHVQALEAVSQAEQSLESHQVFIEDREMMITELEQLRMQSAQIKAAAQSAVIQEIRWGDVMGAILDAQPEAVELTALNQNENEVLISGSAADHTLVLTLGERLTESTLIRAITVNSIEQYYPSPSNGAGDGGESRPSYHFEVSAEVQP
jgi:Tfp pilus assembly protein PilN